MFVCPCISFLTLVSLKLLPGFFMENIHFSSVNACFLMFIWELNGLLLNWVWCFGSLKRYTFYSHDFFFDQNLIFVISIWRTTYYILHYLAMLRGKHFFYLIVYHKQSFCLVKIEIRVYNHRFVDYTICYCHRLFWRTKDPDHLLIIFVCVCEHD